MALILGWILRIAFIAKSLILSKIALLFEDLLMSSFCIMLEKKSFGISAVSRSVLIRLPFSVKWILFLPTILSDKIGFTLFQKSLFSMTDFSFKFSLCLF